MSVQGDLFFDCLLCFPMVQLLTRKKRENCRQTTHEGITRGVRMRKKGSFKRVLSVEKKVNSVLM